MKPSLQKKNHRNRLAWLVLALVAIVAGWTFTASATQATLREQFAQETPDAPAGEPSPASAEATTADPDFSTVDDPLNGDYELYTVDDLLIARTKPGNNNTRSFVYNYILETDNETITSQSAQLPDSPECYLTSGRQPQQTRIGRFFDLPYDVIVTLLPYGVTATDSDCSAPAGQPNMALHIQSPQFAANTATPFSMSAASTALAMDDFDLDGYEDLFIMSDAEVLIATAKNITDNNDGMVLGPAAALPAASYATNYDPATGDFNGDGLLDVAWIGQDDVVHLATVCPDAVAGTVCDGRTALEIVLDPGNAGTINIKVNEDGADCFSNGYPVTTVTLTAGQYSGQKGSELLTVDTVKTGSTTVFGIEVPICAYQLHKYSIDENFSLIDKISATVVDEPRTSIGLYATNFYAQSANLAWFDGQEQAIIVIGGGIVDEINGEYLDPITTVFVVSFSGATPIIAQASTRVVGPNWGSQQPWVNGMAIGHYTAIADNATTETEFNQQIAVLTNDGTVNIYGVPNPPTNITPALLASSTVDSSLGLNERPPNESTFTSWLVAGDLQGRSARLGPPSVIRMASHSQPSVILGAPPMHVDYILPDSSTSSDWEIVNFTAVPDAYNSTYAMSQTTTNQSSDTRKTSYTYSTVENSDLGFSLKPPYVPSISGSLKKTTENKNETVSEDYSFTQNEYKYNATTTTGFGDQIWYDLSDFNVYVYPVLGQTVCPNDIPNCTADQEQPLYVMFSGPSDSSINPGGGILPAPGPTTEWYQPVHEPGNIFSYPWSEALLAQQFVQEIDVQSGPNPFLTDDSGQSQSLSWSSSSGESQTAGTTNNHSYEKAYSMTAGKAIGKILDVNLQGNLDYSESSSFSSLNKTSSSLGSSTGIEIDKPGTFLNHVLYQYEVYPYIFGRTPPAGTVDSVPLTQPIQTFGPLQAAFAVDPLAPGTGPWWGSDTNPYQQYIDVALNHPVRWSMTTPTGTQDSLNCLPVGGRNDCMVFNDPDPSNWWLSEFYWMRGLYITIGGVNGPQQNSATAGDILTLQARVYNYSFKDMPEGSTIQVGFYRQEVSKSGSTPLGPMEIIDTVETTGLPGFNSDSSPSTPNQKLVSTTLNTAGLDNTFQVFWVLVWAEDSGGNMISELPGHGLKSKPGSVAKIGDVELEKVTLDGVTKTFSNNVGYLHSAFYIAPAGAGAPAPADLALAIQDARVTPSASSPGGRVVVSADIFAGGAVAEDVLVQLFPNPSIPQPFDVELLSYIEADDSIFMEVPYRSNACGRQEILIVATAEDETATATATYDNGPCVAYFPVMPFRSPR